MGCIQALIYALANPFDDPCIAAVPRHDTGSLPAHFRASRWVLKPTASVLSQGLHTTMTIFISLKLNEKLEENAGVALRKLKEKINIATSETQLKGISNFTLSDPETARLSSPLYNVRS